MASYLYGYMANVVSDAASVNTCHFGNCGVIEELAAALLADCLCISTPARVVFFIK